MEQGANLPEEEPYIVHNLKEIIQILNDLLKRKTILKISFNHGQDLCHTTIIEVDNKNHAVYLDIGLDEEFNSRMLASHQVIFSKDDGVRIKWTSAHISLIKLGDGMAIKVALPQKLIRLQRREFFRPVTPIVNLVPCQIPILDETKPDVNRMLEFNLVDVSLGGIGVIASAPLDTALEMGAIFDKCKIRFPDFGETSLTLQVRSITSIPSKDGVIKYRIGFQYIKPSRGNEALISRYIFNIERLALVDANNF